MHSPQRVSAQNGHACAVGATKRPLQQRAHWELRSTATRSNAPLMMPASFAAGRIDAPSTICGSRHAKRRLAYPISVVDGTIAWRCTLQTRSSRAAIALDFAVRTKRQRLSAPRHSTTTLSASRLSTDTSRNGGAIFSGASASFALRFRSFRSVKRRRRRRCCAPCEFVETAEGTRLFSAESLSHSRAAAPALRSRRCGAMGVFPKVDAQAPAKLLARREVGEQSKRVKENDVEAGDAAPPAPLSTAACAECAAPKVKRVEAGDAAPSAPLSTAACAGCAAPKVKTVEAGDAAPSAPLRRVGGVVDIFFSCVSVLSV